MYNCWNKHSMQWTGWLKQRHKATETCYQGERGCTGPWVSGESQAPRRREDIRVWALEPQEDGRTPDTGLWGRHETILFWAPNKDECGLGSRRGAHTQSWAGKDFFHFLDMDTWLTDEDPGQRSLPVHPTPHQLPDSLLSQTLAKLLWTFSP